MSKKTKNTVILLGAVVALVALALPKIASLDKGERNNEKAVNPRDQRMSVRMQIVQQEKIGERVLTVGTILSNEEVEIRSEISGKVEKIYFKEGGKVKKDDMVLKINDDELQARLLSAQYRQALAEQEEQRQRQLFEKTLTSQQDYDKAVNNLNVVKAEVQLIQAQLDKTEIRAPFDGVIGLRFVSVGSYLSPATLITTLQDNSAVKIDFTFPEKYAAEIKPGDKINFTIQGTSRKFTGTVYAIAPKIDPSTRTMRIRAHSPNTDRALVAGAFANVEVQLQEKEGLTIPAFAVIPELKRHKVFVYKDGKAAEQLVEIGMRTEERVEITQGLQAGDTLITSAILQLRPGVAVQPAEIQ
jgi:membrane fusion protein (multidrug efflux system)